MKRYIPPLALSLVAMQCTLGDSARGNDTQDVEQSINRLVVELRSSDREVWKRAGAQLEAIAQECKEAVPLLVRLLGDRDETVRMYARSALAGVGNEVIPAMLLALNDRDHEVRLGALLVLCNVEDDSAIPVRPLQRLLGDRSEDVADVAGTILARMGKRGVAALRAELASPNVRARRMAARGLRNASINAQDSVGDLVQLLKDPDEQVRAEVLIALRWIKASAAAEPLAEFLRTEKVRRLRVGALYALADMPDLILSRPALQTVADSLRRPAPTLGDIAKELGRPYLLAREMDEVYMEKGWAQTILVNHGKKALTVLVPMLADKDWRVRVDVIDVLLAIRGTGKYTIPALKDLLSHEEIEARKSGLEKLFSVVTDSEQLALHEDAVSRARAVLPDIKLRLADQSSAVRIPAAKAVLGIEPQNQDALRMLVKLVEHEDDDLRLEALRAVGHLGTLASCEEMVPALVRGLQATNPSIRQFAINALAKIKATGTRPILMRMAKDDPEESVRTAAKNAVEHLGAQ